MIHKRLDITIGSIPENAGCGSGVGAAGRKGAALAACPRLVDMKCVSLCIKLTNSPLVVRTMIALNMVDLTNSKPNDMVTTTLLASTGSTSI